MLKWNRYEDGVPNPKGTYKTCHTFLIRFTFGGDFFHYATAIYDYEIGQFIPIDTCFNCEKCKCTREEILAAYAGFKVIHWAVLEHVEDYSY